MYGVAPGDDGFSDLTADQYVRWRIEDQFDYYRSKAKKLAQELQRFQWAVYIFGGLGTLLAATELQIWVAVTSAVVAALGSFLEFKRVETNLIACNLAASDLYDIRTWWRALPESSKQLSANKETLVKSAEAVIQGENASWLSEMREALSEIYSDKDAEGEGQGQRAIAVLPENFTQVSESASSASAAFDAVVKGQGGSGFSTMREAIATSMSTQMPPRSDEPNSLTSAEPYAQEASDDWLESPIPFEEESLNGSSTATTEETATHRSVDDADESLMATPPSQDEIVSKLPSVGIDPNDLTNPELTSVQQTQDEEEIDLSETGGVFIEDDVLTPDPYIRDQQPSDLTFSDSNHSDAGIADMGVDTYGRVEEFGSEETGGVFIEVEDDASLEPYTRPQEDLPQDYEDDLKAVDHP